MPLRENKPNKKDIVQNSTKERSKKGTGIKKKKIEDSA
jgi:hypothetical protein